MVPGKFYYDETLGVCFRELDFMGFPWYRVGDDGSLWSRRAGCKKPGELRGWRKLKGCRRSDRRIIMSMRNENVIDSIFIHRVVLQAFVGSCPIGMECRHLDDNPANNTLANLRWGTKSENGHDRTRNLIAVGEEHGGAKLTEEQVRAMRLEYASGGVSIQKIADKYGMCFHAARCAIKKITWKHVN